MSDTTTPTGPAQVGLAIAALVVGIIAFFGGWIPLIGLLLGIVALRRQQSRGFSLTGILLSAVAILANVIVTTIVVVALATGGLAALISGAAQETDRETQSVETPCHSFDGPAGYIDDLSSDAAAACTSELQPWGEQNADGTIDNTGVGSIWGSGDEVIDELVDSRNRE